MKTCYIIHKNIPHRHIADHSEIAGVVMNDDFRVANAIVDKLNEDYLKEEGDWKRPPYWKQEVNCLDLAMCLDRAHV